MTSCQLKLLSAFSIAAGLVYPQSPKMPSSDRSIEPLLQEIETYIEKGMQKTGVPGVAVAVVYRDRVVYLKGFGVREAGCRAPVNPDTVFQLASLSKPIASTVVAALVCTHEV